VTRDPVQLREYVLSQGRCHFEMAIERVPRWSKTCGGEDYLIRRWSSGVESSDAHRWSKTAWR
jgi:hypothetical protein